MGFKDCCGFTSDLNPLGLIVLYCHNYVDATFPANGFSLFSFELKTLSIMLNKVVVNQVNPQRAVLLNNASRFLMTNR